MPRDPSTWRYKIRRDAPISDKMQYMKGLIEKHAGEVRETYGSWEKVWAPLPESRAWYIPQYPESTDVLGMNTFLQRCNDESEHYRRASWGFTLPRLMEKFGEKYTFETIYELFFTLPVMVSKKKRGSNRVAW